MDKSFHLNPDISIITMIVNEHNEAESTVTYALFINGWFIEFYKTEDEAKKIRDAIHHALYNDIRAE